MYYVVLQEHFVLQKLGEVSSTVRIGELRMQSGFCSIDPKSFHQVIFSFSAVDKMNICGQGLSMSLNNRFFEECAIRSVTELTVDALPSFGRGRPATPKPIDDGILAFLFRKTAADVYLSVERLHVTAHFCKRLLEVSMPCVILLLR